MSGYETDTPSGLLSLIIEGNTNLTECESNELAALIQDSGFVSIHHNIASQIAACREWVPDALRRLDNARVIARKLLEASGAYSTLDATPEFPEAYQLAQDLYEALDEKGTRL